MKKRSKLLVLFTLAFALTLLFYPAAPDAFAAKVKIGYVNLQKAMNMSLAGQDAKKELKDEVDRQKEELNLRQEDLKRLKEEIDKKKSVWTKTVKEKKISFFNDKRQEFQQFFYKSGQDLQKKKQEKEAKIIGRLIEITKKIARKKGYTYLFEKSGGGLLVAPAKHDITEDVVKAYDKVYKKER